MTNREQLHRQRRRSYIDQKFWLIAAYLFSFLAGVSVIVAPPARYLDVLGSAITIGWGVADILGSLVALVAVVSAWQVLGDAGGARARTLANLEVPGLRFLAAANGVYALSICFTMLQTADYTRLGGLFSIAVPAYLYWQELRRQRRALNEAAQQHSGSTDHATGT